MLAGVIGGSAAYYRSAAASARQEAEAAVLAVGQLKARSIAAWRTERAADAATVSDDPFLADAFARFLSGSLSATGVTALRSRFDALVRHYHWSDILAVDASGRLRLSLSGRTEGGAVFGEALRAGLADGRPTVADLHVCDYSSKPHVSWVAPLGVSDTGEALAAVVLVADPDEFLYPYLQSWPVPSETAETLLVRHDGDGVLVLNELRHRAGTTLSHKVPLAGSELQAAFAVRGGAGSVRGPDYRGVSVIAAVLPVPDSPWFVISKVDETEALAGWHVRATLVIALMIGLAGLTLASGLSVWRRAERDHFEEMLRSEAVRRAAGIRHDVTLRAIGDAVITTDAEGRVDLLNPIAETLLGWSQDEAIGRPLGDVFRVIDERTRQPVEDPVGLVYRRGRVVGLANHSLLIARDGTERPIADSAAPIHDEERQAVAGVVLVFRDQTKERSSQRALEESEKRYRRLFESAWVGILLIEHATGRILDANPRAEILLGSSQAQLIGSRVWELSAMRAVVNSEAAYAGVQAHEFRFMSDVPVVPHQGHPFDAEVVFTRYQVDQVSVVHCTIRDISEQKRHTAERDRLMAAIEQSGEGVVITDPRGVIQYVNPAFSDMTGYPREEVVGRTPSILKSGTHDAAFYQDLWGTISGGRGWTGRLVNRRKDGSLYTEETTISPVSDGSGRIVNYVAVKRDITRQLSMEAQLAQAQKLESVGRLAGGVAHDYNNMLGVILGRADLALRRTAESDPIREDLDEILKAASRSAAVTRQLLAFARRQAITPRVLDLNDTVEGMLKMLRRLIGEDIELRWLPCGGLWPVLMDPSQVDQILANLCVNARDAITDVGLVTIETDNVDFDEDDCAGRPGFTPGSYVRLSVSDTGCGMDQETLRRIFEPFFTTKEPGKGTGLGLATVYGIVKQNQGFVNVYSEPGNGTTFAIYLPRTSGRVDEPDARADAPVTSGHGETVLLVEDEEAILTLTSAMLTRLGYRVLTAATPGEAERIAAANTLDLVISDVVMPDMNGRDLIDRLRRGRPDVKHLFMSGYTSDIIAHRGIVDGHTRFLQKPFTLSTLAAAVRAALDA